MGKMSKVLKKGGRTIHQGQRVRPGEEQRPRPPQPEVPGAAPGAPAHPGDQAGMPSPDRQDLAGGAGEGPVVDQSPAASAEPRETGGGKKRQLRRRLASRRQLARALTVERERLVSQYAPNSMEAKRIDILRSQLLYPFHGEPPRVVMIASAVPAEGRSLLTANLAISFARGLQQFVMVMDCHFRRPVMHQLLGVPRRQGLTDYLEHDASVPDIIHWSLIPKLSVVPAGSPSHRSAELLATDKMAALMEELRSRYRDRYIILDTPPVQMVDDPALLARLVDGIVFVVLSGFTDREVVLRALGGLPEEKIIGIVLNDKLRAVTDAYNITSPAVSEGLEL